MHFDVWNAGNGVHFTPPMLAGRVITAEKIRPSHVKLKASKDLTLITQTKNSQSNVGQSLVNMANI